MGFALEEVGPCHGTVCGGGKGRREFLHIIGDFDLAAIKRAIAEGSNRGAFYPVAAKTVRMSIFGTAALAAPSA